MKRVKRWMGAVACAVWFCSAALAKEAPPLAEDPVLEQRLARLAEELRCLVCQNESLAESRAELANDLRREVRELMRQGKSDREVVDFLVQRYGDFVLYRPPLKSKTLLLWGGPFILLAVGVAVMGVYLRRRGSRTADRDLSEHERQRAEALLAETPGEEKT